MWSLQQFSALLLLSTLVVTAPLPAEFAPSADVVSHSVETESRLVGRSNQPSPRLVQRSDDTSELAAAPEDRTVLDDAISMGIGATTLQAALASIAILAVSPVPNTYSALVAFGASYTGE